MEHLSLPQGAEINDSEKAFCIADPYDCGPFLTFPQRSRFSDIYEKLTGNHGWPSLSWRPSIIETRELDVFIQTWLFFGLLHEVFGDGAPASKFIDNQFFITTAKLGEIVDEWVSRHHGPKDHHIKLCEHLKECVLRAWNTSLIMCRTAKLSISILRSIAALCETLEDVILGTLSSGPRSLSTTWGWFHNFSEIDRIMKKNGWCPVNVPKWRAAANTFHGVHYLSKLKNYATKDHSRCVGNVCVANQCEDYSIASMHTPDCQHGCTELSVDEEKLMAILADGKVAILDITLHPESSELTIAVVPANDQRQYTAISHVWADGLGNLNGNYLPTCQITRIAKMVQSLQDAASTEGTKLYLWLDTLCCPVKSRTHRAQCLILMREIYSNAAHVLVLDAQLKEYHSREIDNLEICARLLFSVWSTRLWTLQEGALARRGGLWIQLRDQAVNIEALGADLIQRYGTHLIDGHLTLVLASSLARLRRFVDAGDTSYSAANLVDLRMAVKTRSVSVPADESLCLATCMGLDQRNLVQVAPEDRMQEFWISMRKSGKEIPSNVLFFYGERLKAPGFRWAPVSFLEKVVFNKFWLPRSVEEVGHMTDYGLRVLIPACEIAVPISDPEKGWEEILRGLQPEVPVRQSSSRWYRIVIGCNVPGPWTTLSTVEVLRRNSGRNVLLSEPALWDLSFQHEAADLAQAVSGSITSTSASSTGICFSVGMTVVVGLMTEQDAYVHERAWQISRSAELWKNFPASSLLRDPLEQIVLSEHEQLSRLSNPAFKEIWAEVESALKEDSALSHNLAHRRRDYFAECILRFMGGWYGQIERNWPRSQCWVVD